MATTINADTSTGGAIVTGDASGVLGLQAAGSTQVTISTSGVVLANPLPVASGGTGGSATPTAGGVVYGTGTVQAVTAAGTSGQVLQSNGASAPSWITPSSGALVFISSATASSSAAVTFTGLSSTYAVYVVEMVSIVGASNAQLYLRTSSNNGSSYDTSGYAYSTFGGQTSNGNVNVDSSYGAIGYISVSNNGGSISNVASDGGLSGVLYVMDPAASNYTQFLMSETHNTGSFGVHGHGMGYRSSTTPVNAIQLYMSSGNIASGTFRLYGIANS